MYTIKYKLYFVSQKTCIQHKFIYNFDVPFHVLFKKLFELFCLRGTSIYIPLVHAFKKGYISNIRVYISGTLRGARHNTLITNMFNKFYLEMRHLDHKSMFLKTVGAASLCY